MPELLHGAGVALIQLGKVQTQIGGIIVLDLRHQHLPGLDGRERHLDDVAAVRCSIQQRAPEGISLVVA